MVSSRQIIGVIIWQQLVQGCLFCRCRFFRISALIWCPYFSLIIIRILIIQILISKKLPTFY